MTRNAVMCGAFFHNAEPEPPCSGKEAIPSREIRRINSWRKIRDALFLRKTACQVRYMPGRVMDNALIARSFTWDCMAHEIF
ncbi:hypothetical protein [uncultured Desulfobacter sp.]|uniref:hypothetical protein n=1 Tax=uncultured Desulfobacter sp. TaxID=240139 RepID=UPI0029F49C77|nr:hypothetical protein [uncultured Desulfobacter sp.]